MSEQTQLRVGSKVWVFDENSRAYGPDHKIIYRAHWREATITGETRDSWILGYYGKAPKKFTDLWFTRPTPYTGTRHRVAATQSEVEDSVWLEENRYRIERETGRCSDPATLRKIDELLKAAKA